MVALRTLTWDEPKAISDVLKHEFASEYCREGVTIASGSGELEIGTVLGKVTTGSASVAAKAGGNTGAGTLTLDPTTPVRPGAKAGVYTVRCIAAATNSGTFVVLDPDGYSLGQVVVGATFDNDIKFVIADDGTDFAVGDGFDITVAEGTGKWVPYNPGGSGGAERVAGVLLQKVNATSADIQAVVLARGPAVISRLGISWHSSVDSSSKKAAGTAQLVALGIVVRDSA